VDAALGSGSSAGERTDADYEAAGDLEPAQRQRMDAMWKQLNGGRSGDGGGGGEVKADGASGSANVGGQGGGGGGAKGGLAAAAEAGVSKGRAALDILAKLVDKHPEP